MLQRIEDFYDAVPRPAARVEAFGPLTLFVREGAGWPFYARPTPGGGPIQRADVEAVLARQRELGVPEAFEWVPQLAPTMSPSAAEAGLVVRHCPLLVLDGEPTASSDVDLRVLRGDEADLAVAEAVCEVGFGADIGTQVGAAGVADRDDAALALDQGRLDRLRSGLADGSAARVSAYDGAFGPVSTGGYQHALGVVEVVGVATLPMARRRGLAGAVTARLAALARERGFSLVFLSAQDDDVARVYERIGFRRMAIVGLVEPEG